MASIPTNFGEAGRNLGEGHGKPTMATIAREMADDFAELRTQFIALLVKLDTELSLEEAVELINDLKTKYEAHRILTSGSVHTNADGTNAVTVANATDLASAMALANDVKAKYNLHDAVASELEEAFTLLNELKVDYNAHRSEAGAHVNNDAGNAVASADATDLATSYTLANEIKTDYEAHRAAASGLEEAIVLLNEIKVDYEAHRILTAGSVHGGADATNAVTAADASDLATAYTLADDLKVQYEAHRVLTAGSVHGAADSTNTIAAANATTYDTLITLANELRVDYEAHRVLIAASVHGAADATNVVSSVAAETAGIHEQDDVTNTVAASDATTFATLKTLTNELRTDYEAHRVDTTSHLSADATNTVSAVAVGSAGIHLIDDTVNVVTSADATTQATLNTLTNELRVDYEAHRVNTTAHGAADATNVVSEPPASTNYEATLTPAALLTTKA